MRCDLGYKKEPQENRLSMGHGVSLPLLKAVKLMKARKEYEGFIGSGSRL